MLDNEVETIWNEFWKHIVTVEGKGVSLNAVKREFADYYRILQNVPTVYMEITGGRLSNPFDDSDTVIAEYEKHLNELIDDEVDDIDD